MNTLISLIFASAASAALSGNQKITTHDYNQIQGALDTNPVFCGYPGSQLDISRITAVQGLTQSQCGACLKVCNADDPSKHQYVLAVDRGGVGLDLNMDSFYALFGDRTGLYGATWEQVDNSNCAGILQNGNQYKANPAPATTVNPPVVAATTDYVVKTTTTATTTTTTTPAYVEKTTTTTNPPVVPTTTTTTTPAYVEKTTTTTTTNPPVVPTTTTTTTDAYPVNTTTATTTTNDYPVNTTTATTTTTTDAYSVNTTTTTNAYPVNTTTTTTTATTTTDAYPVSTTTTTTDAYPVNTTTTTTTSPDTYPTINPQKRKCHRPAVNNN
jgi:hypothetical protein